MITFADYSNTYSATTKMTPYKADKLRREWCREVAKDTIREMQMDDKRLTEKEGNK